MEADLPQADRRNLSKLIPGGKYSDGGFERGFSEIGGPGDQRADARWTASS